MLAHSVECARLAALLAAALLACALARPGAADAQVAGTPAAAADTVYEIRLRDGSVLVGRIVSDAGGFDDKSFNQLGYEGAKQAADELGVELTPVESNSENDYGPNLESLVGEGCDVIVTVGFALAAATKESAAANPDIEYVLIDDSADGGEDGETFDGGEVVEVLKTGGRVTIYSPVAGPDT